jgi:hypothetical protein
MLMNPGLPPHPGPGLIWGVPNAWVQLETELGGIDPDAPELKLIPAEKSPF